MRRNSWGLNGSREHFYESHRSSWARITATGKWRKTNPRKIQGNNEQDLASEDMQGQETLDSSGQQKWYHSSRGSTGWAFLVTVVTHKQEFWCPWPLEVPSPVLPAEVLDDLRDAVSLLRLICVTCMCVLPLLGPEPSQKVSWKWLLGCSVSHLEYRLQESPAAQTQLCFLGSYFTLPDCCLLEMNPGLPHFIRKLKLFPKTSKEENEIVFSFDCGHNKIAI